MWNYRKYPPSPKINWIHDCWTLTQIMNRREGLDRLILQSLVYLRAGVSYTRTAKLVETARANLVAWALLYNKGYGLELLVSPPHCIAAIHARRIEQFVKNNPTQFRSLMSGDDMELYADWADVDSEMLAAWIVQREYYGEPLVAPRKRSYTKRTRKHK
jgi:hypothetical protein